MFMFFVKCEKNNNKTNQKIIVTNKKTINTANDGDQKCSQTYSKCKQIPWEFLFTIVLLFKVGTLSKIFRDISLLLTD
jgi:hypothetical protein